MKKVNHHFSLFIISEYLKLYEKAIREYKAYQPVTTDEELKNAILGELQKLISVLEQKKLELAPILHYVTVNSIKEMQMRIKHILAVASVMLILGFGSNLMAQKGQGGPNDASTGRTENRPGARLFFMDENGDGICDHFQDHDGDGIPNGQDPDWERPKDGSGSQKRLGRRQQTGNAFANRNAFREQNGDGRYNRSFRFQRNQSGNSGCDDSGPKGKGSGGGGK